eukprot:5359868-Pyramimonas_sp.AAC.1
MKGGPLFKFGSRIGAAHIRLKVCENFTEGGWPVFRMWISPQRRAHPSSIMYELHAGGQLLFQSVALASVPRTFFLNSCKNFADGGRFLFNM